MKQPRVITALALLLLSVQAVRADVRTEQKTKVEFAGMLGRMMNIFGGKAARDGVTSTVAVKGDRNATLNDATGQIVDLGEEKVYDLDLKKHSFKVTTFAELRRRMEEARKKAEENARKEQGKDKAEADPNAPQVEIDVDAKNTGERKTVNGFDTRQEIVTITVREKGKTLEQGGGMVMTSDLWLTPRIAAMKDIADFDARYAKKLYGDQISGVSAEQMATAMAMYPHLKDAMGRMTTEGARLDGTAIVTTTTIDSVKSADQVAQEARQSEPDSKPTTVGGLMGGFAKKMAAKRAGGDDAAKARATFMTTTTEVLKVVSEVSGADVAVPAGFKEDK